MLMAKIAGDALAAPYTVVTERPECKRCHHGQLWAIEGPDGVLTGSSYSEEVDAEEEATALNEAFRLGRIDGFETAHRGDAL